MKNNIPVLPTGASSFATDAAFSPRVVLAYAGEAYETMAKIRALNELIRSSNASIEDVTAMYEAIAHTHPHTLAAALQDADCLEERLLPETVAQLRDRVVTVGVRDALSSCDGLVDLILALTDPAIPSGYFAMGDGSESNEAINRLNSIMSALRCTVTRDAIRSVATLAHAIVNVAKEIPGVSGSPCPPVERILECREVVEGTLRRLAQETGMRDESLVDALEHLHEMVGSLEEATRPDAEHGSVLHIRHAMTRTHQWATASPGAAFNAVVDQRARELTTTDARYAREAQRERERERDAAIEEVSRLKEQLAAAKDTDIYRQLVETRAAADREIEQARGEVARARAAADRDAQQARNDVARMRGSMKTLETEMRALEKQHARRLEAMEALEAKVEDLTRQVQTRRVEYVPVHGTVAGSEDAAPHSDPGDGDVSMRFALLEIER